MKFASRYTYIDVELDEPGFARDHLRSLAEYGTDEEVVAASDAIDEAEAERRLTALARGVVVLPRTHQPLVKGRVR